MAANHRLSPPDKRNILYPYVCVVWFASLWSCWRTEFQTQPSLRGSKSQACSLCYGHYGFTGLARFTVWMEGFPQIWSTGAVSGNRPTGHPHPCFKDVNKCHLKGLYSDDDRWEDIIKEQTQWRQELNKGLVREEQGQDNLHLRGESGGKTTKCLSRVRQTSRAADVTVSGQLPQKGHFDKWMSNVHNM